MGRLLWCWMLALLLGLLFVVTQPPRAHSQARSSSSQPLNEAHPEWVMCQTADDCTDTRSAQIFANRGCNRKEPVNKAFEKEAEAWLTQDRVNNMQCQYPVRWIRMKHCGFQCVPNRAFDMNQCDYILDCEPKKKRRHSDSNSP